VADAMARATAAASGAKRTIDRVVRIDETQGSMPFPQQQSFAAARAMSDAAAPATPVAEGELEIRARVTVTAVIK